MLNYESVKVNHISSLKGKRNDRLRGIKTGTILS